MLLQQYPTGTGLRRRFCGRYGCSRPQAPAASRMGARAVCSGSVKHGSRRAAIP